MSAYVGYFDCAAAQWTIVVTNIMGRASSYRLRVFDLTGTPIADEEHVLSAHASERINLNDLAVDQQGHVLIQPVEDEDDDFPATMVIADTGGEPTTITRLLPLTRIEEMPEEDDEDEEDDDDEDDEEEEDKDEEDVDDEDEDEREHDKNKKKGRKGKKEDD